MWGKPKFNFESLKMDIEEKDHSDIQVQYLLNASFTLESSSCKKLSSYMNTHASIIAHHDKIDFPKDMFSKARACQYCLTPWAMNKTKVKLLPQIRPGKKIRKILSKERRRKPLSLIEKKLIALLHSGNKLAVTCLMCHKATSYLINKYHPPPAPITETSKKKKKKRKKDKFAGLNPDVVPLKPKAVKNSNVNDDSDDESEDSVVLVPVQRNKIETVTKNEEEEENEDDIEIVEDGPMVIDKVGQPVDKKHTAKINIVTPQYEEKKPIVLGTSMKKSTKKFNTPLGAVKTPVLKKSEAVPFIALGPPSPKTNNKKGKSNLSLKKVHLNPFCPDAQNLRKKTKKKGYLQELLKKEESLKGKKKSSLNDFLSLI